MKIVFRPVALGVGTAVIVSLAAANPACADPVSAQQQSLLDQFNLIDRGNLTEFSDIQGRAFVGGNVTGSLDVGTGNVTASPYNTLVVDGSVEAGGEVNGGFTVGGNVDGHTYGNVSTNNGAGTASQVAGSVSNINLGGGTLAYGALQNPGTPKNPGTLSTNNINLNSDASATQVSGLSTDPLPVSTFATLTTLSSTLSALASTSTVSISSGQATFNAVAGADGLAVFDINATSFFDDVSGITFNIPNTVDGVIINVEGVGYTPISDIANFNGTTPNGSDLLWNFGDAKSLDISSEFFGTVLAPDADVTTTAAIDGTLVADSATLGGELHSDPFGNPSTPVPEPASAAIVLVGLGTLAVLRRRRVL